MRDRRYLSLALICLAAACLLRIPFWPAHLYSEDCINFANALRRFDPALGHPQLPGYPLFVLQSQLIHRWVPSVEKTFLVGVVIGTALSLFLLLLLGREMFGEWPPVAIGAGLFFVNPAFLFSGMTSTIRIYLAALSLLVAYLCWRTWTHRAALALGAGSGYRPGVLLFLFPLWLVSAWRSRRSWREFAGGFALLALSAGVWIGVVISRHGGLDNSYSALTGYLMNQSRGSSPLYGASLDGWLRMLGKLLAWNGMAVTGWLLFVPFARTRLPKGASAFFALWIVPAIAFHAVIHIGAPDQALVTIPAFCLIGGFVLASLLRRHLVAGYLALLFAFTLNLRTFYRPISMRPSVLPMRAQVAEGLWEMSWPVFKAVSEESKAAIHNLDQALRDSPVETLVVWNRAPVTWRKLAYYFPKRTFCVLMDELHTDIYRPEAWLWRDDRLLQRYEGDPVTVPLGGTRRIVWILGERSPLLKVLKPRLQGGEAGIYWSSAGPMDLPGYRFVP